MRARVRGLIERGGTLAAVGLVLGLGVYQGLQTEEVTLDLSGLFVRIAMVEAVTSTFVFTAVVLVSGAMLAREVYRDTDADERRLHGPRVAALVPAYRDAAVLEESVETLLDSNYQNLEVVIVGEPDDDETLEAAREYTRYADVRVLENRNPGSKANAINDAVDRLDADYFCAFDADERVDPDFVPTAMYHVLEEDFDVFQARRVPRVTGSVEALAYCERLLFHAGYKIVEPLGFTYCRSSSVLFTREAFEAVGGLDDVLTEDLDFAHKSYRGRLNVRQARNVTNEMEAPHTLRDLWGQRKRWRLGHIELVGKALSGGYDRGGVRGKLSTLRMMTTLTASVFLVMLAAKVMLLALLDLQLFFVLPFVAIALTTIPVAYRDYNADHIRTLAPAMALVPLVYPGFGLLTIRCGFEYLFSWEGEWYEVEKAGS